MILSNMLRIAGVAGLGGLMLLAGCGDQPDLPTSINTQPEDFGANDTSFVRVGPDWDYLYGHDWEKPSDLLVSYDGRLFVVDQAQVNGHTNGRVAQLTRSGMVLKADLFAGVADTSQPPLGIGQDSRLNLYMVNGTNSIHVWNQYVNDIGVQTLIQQFVLKDTTNGDSIIIDNTRPLYQQIPNGWNTLSDPNLVIVEGSLVATTNPDSTRLWENEYLFFRDTSDTHANASFSDVDGGPSRSGTIYVTDRGSASGGDRIFTLSVLPARILILKNGTVNYVYTAGAPNQIIGFGTGQASTNDPTSIVTGGSGSGTTVYFTQASSNFRVQRVKRDAGGDWRTDLGGGSGGEPTVMRIGYFTTPSAIAVGEADSRGLGLFYVADMAKNRVTAFHPNGWEFRQVAVDEKLYDLGPKESLDAVMAESGETLDPNLNPSLVDFVNYASRREEVELDSSDVLLDILAERNIPFDLAYNDTSLTTFIAPRDTSITVFVGIDTTIRVLFPILNDPQGVATLEGVVYIADTGNDRILRFRRTDSDSYIPGDPE